MDKALSNILGNKHMSMWHLVTLAVIIMYVSFCFPDISARLGFHFHEQERIYHITDALAAMVFLHIMVTKRNHVARTMALLSLIWLVTNYIPQLSQGRKVWRAYDGFATAVILMSYLH